MGIEIGTLPATPTTTMHSQSATPVSQYTQITGVSRDVYDKQIRKQRIARDRFEWSHRNGIRTLEQIKNAGMFDVEPYRYVPKSNIIFLRVVCQLKVINVLCVKRIC